MKIRLSNTLKKAASALLVVMILGGLLCLFVMYYLALVEQQNKLSIRSQAWNIAIAVSEAGIEEALQALNSARTPGVFPIPLSPTEWYYDGSYYWRTNTHAALGGNWYFVRINLSNPFEPQIISRAYVSLPALAAGTPTAFFAAAGVTTGPGVVTRAVRVYCKDYPLFRAAMVAKHKIDMKGNGILTDSFDSRSLWMSVFGQYDGNYYSGDKGDVASNDGVVGAIGVGNAEIFGRAHTGAEGTVTINQGWVGPHPKGAPGGSADGWILQDANFTFPETKLPYNGTLALPLGGPADVPTVTYDYTRTSTNSTSYPALPSWSGVKTNVTSYTTNLTCPNPPPPDVISTTIWVTNSAAPLPMPQGTITLTVPDRSTLEPAPGTYVPPYTKTATLYYFQRITGYAWQTTGYVWPNYSYAYNLYTTNVVYATNHYDQVLNSGDYYSAADLKGSTLVQGTARLVLPNGLQMSGGDKITVAFGASLELYVGGTNCAVSGNAIVNESGYAGNFLLECTESVKTFKFDGNGEFMGVLVAPNADCTLNGGGHGNDDFIGALMMNSITLNGHYSFHFDEALMAKFPNPRLLVKSWDEIR